MKKNKVLMGAAVCSLLLLASCGTSKMAQGNATTGQTVASKETKATGAQQSEAVKKLTFVQKVSDNQVYAKNIVGNMSFNLQMGGKDITVPGSLHMRKDEVIRIQLFIPILGTEVGRLEFTPNYVLIIDRLHKEWRPDGFVVGDPMTLDGGDQPIRERARAFARELVRRFRLPVVMVDERSSSIEAAQRFAVDLRT